MNAVVNPITEDAILLRQHTDDGIAILTLNRPQQFNALSQALLGELQNALDDISTDKTVRVVIIASNGRAFCAGHDLKEMRSSNERSFHQALFEQCSRMMLSINRPPQPVIAQVHGIATAAGCQLVAACDLAVAAADARFAVSGVNLGLFCSTPSVALSRNLGRKQALQMLLTGDFIDADTALQYGLIGQIVAPDQLAAASRELAAKICAKSPLAIMTGKKMFYKQLGMDLEDAYRYAGEVMACNFDSADAREGVDAFFARRPPQWQGR
jgi:enoyl-CoA hydratase/carnithine racemase